ncbi:hypothetical protein CENSYa_0741 [Cenarchaeum symbiosum A]|uniref:Uncharacterized protein n=1 Tax=Cenarchaeum symbiosum (strain A) TaxID=414004 RepID=A0RVK7_CENSY|nr:hypothetical protein CENSYa_0741 [Cenarchaeum symbiosum A]
MLWMTRGESAGLYRILDDIADQQLPKSEMAEMAENIKGMRAEMLPKKDMAEMAENIKGMMAEMKTESEMTRKILGSMSATLKSIDGKLEGIPGPPEPVTLPTGNGGTCV